MLDWEPPEPSASHFYRYQSAVHLDWLESILKEHRVYLPRFEEVNDPRDGKPPLVDKPADEIVQFLYHGYCQREPNATAEQRAAVLNETKLIAAFSGRRWLLREMQAELHRYFDATPVFCMSARWNNLQMWANYADGRRGYCLEFANTEPFSAARMVVYKDGGALDVTKSEDAHFGWFYQKRTEWSHEEEIRLVFPRLWNLRYLPFPPKALTRIILGERMLPDYRDSILRWSDERTPKLPVSALRYDDFRQEVVMVPVTK